MLTNNVFLNILPTQTNNTPAAPANAPAIPIIFCCPFIPTGAAAAVLCVAAPVPLALLALLALALLELAALALLELAALALLALAALALLALALDLELTALVKMTLALLSTLAGTELAITTVAVLNSVGTVVLNSSVTGATGASPVAEGVLVPTMLVSACCELPSSDSVETSTVKG